MEVEGGLEKKLKRYPEAVGIGQGVGLATTAAGVLNAEKFASYLSIENLLTKSYNVFGYNVTPGLPVLAAAFNFIGDQIGFAASLYAFNRERYKGLKGKGRFINDFANLGFRHLGSYIISYPLAIAASTALIATGLFTGFVATMIPYVAESLITALGYIFSTRWYRKTAYAPA